MAEKRIGIVANPLKDGGKELVLELGDKFTKLGHSVVVEDETACLAGVDGAGDMLAVADASDLIVVLGGDGTMLYVANQLGPKVKPLAGINIGGLGFLTCATTSETDKFVDAISDGTYRLSERVVVEVDFVDSKGKARTIHGLNEATLNRGNVSKMIRLSATVNGQPLNRYGGDGLIVATPTGSTAYSLSAGGPLVTPEADVLLVTPICSHAMSNRAIVLAGDSVIEITQEEGRNEMILSVDGRTSHVLGMDAPVVIRPASFRFPLVRMADYSFYRVLQEKLDWKGSNV